MNGGSRKSNNRKGEGPIESTRGANTSAWPKHLGMVCRLTHTRITRAPLGTRFDENSLP
jgi:hypothetical protein